MKYAIYDKATNAYLTDIDVDIVCSTDTQFTCAYAEYITNAKLLDTKESATDVVTRTEGLKFMDKGRFVIHSFDDTLKDQYIISEAGNPTKVVDNITVDLDGTVNVKYGTMMCHWSAISLEYTINRLNRLQEAISPKYGSWRATFDIYKVITIIDDKEHTHYQFINVTSEGLEKYSKDEKESPLNKRITSNWKYLYEEIYEEIEELKKANYELGEQVAERGIVANRLLDENNSLKTKVESIKKEAHDWKNLYKKADRECDVLKNVIDNIYDDLHSDNMYKDLKHTYDYIHNFSELHDIKIHNDDDDTGMPIYITANVEFRCIIDKIIAIIESRELSKKYCAYASKAIANNIVDICKADDEFNITLKKFSELYEAVNAVYNTDNDLIIHAFKSILLIFSTMDSELENFAAEIVGCKNKAQKAEKALENQKKLNEAIVVTIVRYRNEKMAKDKELSDLKRRVEEAEKSLNNQLELNHGVCDENRELRIARDCTANIIYAIRNAIVNGNTDTFDCIISRMKIDSDFNSDPFMAGVRENIKDICDAEKRNITNHAFKCRELARSSKELSDAADALEEVNDKNEELTNMLKEITSYVADIMLATRTTDHDKMISDLMDVSLKIGVKTMDDGPMYGISVILAMLIRFLKEKGEALELNEKYKK